MLPIPRKAPNIASIFPATTVSVGAAAVALVAVVVEFTVELTTDAV